MCSSNPVPIETLWQETAVWHPRVNPGDSLREPMVPLLAYVKKLFVGVNREAVVVFPPFREIRDEDAARVSMFTLLGAADRPTTGAARALPAFFTFLPPLP